MTRRSIPALRVSLLIAGWVACGCSPDGGAGPVSPGPAGSGGSSAGSAGSSAGLGGSGTAAGAGGAGATGGEGTAGGSGAAGNGGSAGSAGQGGSGNQTADAAFAAFNALFYTVTDGNGFYLDNSGSADTNGWWGQAELIEMAIDAYDRNPSTEHETIMNELVYGFVDRWGSDWSYNEYNDDIAWMSIASLRAHLNTDNPDFLEYAKSNWDTMYARAWDTSFAGGGLWWRTDNNTKNACIQGPGAIAAYLLYKATGEADYLDKAITIYGWERETLFEPETGAIHDRIEVANGLQFGSLTYNQGTFIGIANYLYQETGETSYFDDAKAAADFLRYSLCDEEGLPHENQISGDFASFKLIGFRWLAKFVADNDLGDEYYPWLQSVANRAWANRRADGISWNDWTQATPHRILDGVGAAATVQILQVVPPGGDPVEWYNSAPQDGRSNLQAESCDEKRGAIIEDGGTGQQLGGVTDGTWARYGNVDFGETAPTTFQAHASVAAGAGGTIEVRLDALDGPLIGTCAVTSTGDWATYADFTAALEPVTGAHDVYLVFKTTNGATHVANLDWFTLL